MSGMLEDIILTVTARNQTQKGFDQAKDSAKKTAGAIKTAIGSAMTMVGAYTLNYAKTAVQSAMTAEAEWGKFGSAVKRQGVDWEQQSSDIKAWAVDYSNAMGRSVGDTREAMTTMLTYGMSLDETKKTMEAVSNYASATGKTQAEASELVVKAFNGQGRALKSLGLNIKDFTDESTGAVDKTKLLDAIMQKTSGSADAYSKTTQASMQRMENSLNGLKTDIGSAIAESLAPIIPVIVDLVKWFRELPAPVKSGIAILIMIGGAIGLLAGPITAIIGLMETLGITLTISFAPIWLAVAAVVVLIIALEKLGESMGLWTGWGDMLGKMWDMIVDGIKAVANFFIWLYNTISNYTQQLVVGVLTRIRNALVFILSIPIRILTAYINFQIQMFTMLMQLSEMMRNAFFNMLQTVWNIVVNGVSQLASAFWGIVTTIAGVYASAISYAINLGQGIYNGIVNPVRGIADFIGNEFNNIPSKITGAIGAAVDAVMNFGSSIWDAFKKSIGVASPSFFVKQLKTDFSMIPSVISATKQKGKNAVVGYAKSLVGAYDTSKLTPNAVNSVMNMKPSTPQNTGNVYNNNNNSNASTVNIGEGAIQLDARNLTTQESKQIMINALEGLSGYTNNSGA